MLCDPLSNAKSCPSIESAPNDASRGARSSDDPILLPECREMLASGDVGQMIAALLLTMSANQRKTARTMKDAALQAETSAQEKKIDAMESEASTKLVTGLASGALTISSGAAQMNGEQGLSAIYQGEGKLTEAVGGFVAASHERNKERAELAAKQANRGVEAASDNDKDAKETAKKAIDLLKEWQGAKQDASKAALFRA